MKSVEPHADHAVKATPVRDPGESPCPEPNRRLGMEARDHPPGHDECFSDFLMRTLKAAIAKDTRHGRRRMRDLGGLGGMPRSGADGG